MPREYEWLADATDETNVPTVLSKPSRGSITACIVARNEEALIGRTLASLRDVVDEIVVVHDGPCSDRTLAIAETFNCRVFVRDLYGHAEHHLPFAYACARCEWLLTIDADEFLSEGLRSALRSLTIPTEVDGYEFLWKLWDGSRYTTEHGPYKLALVRRAALRMVGIIHSKGIVDGVSKRAPLHLEHRPRMNNFSVRALATKWRFRAQLHAREYLTELDRIPRFNYPGTLRWLPSRRDKNRWALAFVVPDAVHTFCHDMRHRRGDLPFMPRLKYGLTHGAYRGMVMAYVAVEACRGLKR